MLQASTSALLPAADCRAALPRVGARLPDAPSYAQYERADSCESNIVMDTEYITGEHDGTSLQMCLFNCFYVSSY